MDCPACRNPMITLELEDVEIDYCEGCGGIWLDRGELEMLLGDGGSTRRLMDSFRVDAGTPEQERRCPVCLKRMEKVVAGEEMPAVLIDRCKRGDGLWFDKRELSDVIARAVLDPGSKIPKLLADMFAERPAGEGHNAQGGTI